MMCIGRCPIEFGTSLETEQIRPSQVTIRGTGGEVCMACGETVFGAKHARRTVRDARSRKSRVSKVELRQAGYDYNTEAELDRGR